MLERLFGIRENESSVKSEVVGGLTTFVTMAYIIVVNPAILHFAGIPEGPSTVATILVAIFGCLLMGFFANRPFAIAPYMGENAFIAFGLASLGVSWEVRIGAVFLGGVLFLLLTLFRVRQLLASAISPSLKYSFGVAIGLFLAFIGLYETGIVTSKVEGMTLGGLMGGNPATMVPPGGDLGGMVLKRPDVPVMLGNFHDPKVLLAIFGFVLIAVLSRLRVTGAILIGIVATGALGALMGFAQAPTGIVSLPFTGNETLTPIFLHLDIRGALQLSLLPVILTLMLMAFLDTTGTLVGLGAAAGLLDKNGDLPRAERPMITDALSCIFASIVGTSTSGAFVESAAGIKAGARTGLSSVVVAGLFAVSLFFIPLFTPLQSMAFAYGPALVFVAVLMLPAIKQVDFEDLTEAVPAFIAIALTIFTYSVANGLSAALAVYPFLKLFSGRGKEVKIGSWILGLMCLAYYVVSHS